MRWIKKPEIVKVKSFATTVPSGLIAHTEKGFYYIKGNKRFKFISERAMLSWSLPVLEIKEADLSGLNLMGSLGLRDGSLVKNIADGKIYIISDSKRRHVIDPDVLEWFDVKIIEVGDKEILAHEEGEPLDGNTKR